MYTKRHLRFRLEGFAWSWDHPRPSWIYFEQVEKSNMSENQDVPRRTNIFVYVMCGHQKHNLIGPLVFFVVSGHFGRLQNVWAVKKPHLLGPRALLFVSGHFGHLNK